MSIRNTDFLITDPLNQPGVVPEVPQGVTMVDLDDVPYRAEPQIHCAFCRQRQLHNDGYFAVLSDGQRAPCGNCCAANFDDVKKRTIDKSRRRLKREREDRERGQSVCAGLEELFAIAKDADVAFGKISAARYVIGEVLTDEACHDLSSRGIQGLVIINGCFARLSYSQATLSTIWRQSRNGITKTQAQRFAAAKANAISELLEAVEYLNHCRDFFAPSNIVAMETWAKAHGAKFGVRQFKLKNGVLHLKGLHLWQNVKLPEIDPPSLEKLHEIVGPR